MQTGSVTRHGRGWCGYYREDGRSRWTSTYPRKGDARAALNRELDRLALGDRYIAPITLQELSDRWLAQYDRSPRTMNAARVRLVRPHERCKRDASSTSTAARSVSRRPSGKLGLLLARGVEARARGRRPRVSRAVQPAAHVRVLVAQGWCADRDGRLRDGSRRRVTDVPGRRWVVPRDGR